MHLYLLPIPCVYVQIERCPRIGLERKICATPVIPTVQKTEAGGSQSYRLHELQNEFKATICNLVSLILSQKSVIIIIRGGGGGGLGTQGCGRMFPGHVQSSGLKSLALQVNYVCLV